MSKEVQMSIKMEADFRDRFMVAAANQHRLAAQVVRELMQRFDDETETPNELTAETLRKSLRGEDVPHSSSVAELFGQLDI